jgi:murein DD-endopeptidase MepM/ murein hydrolase activator NlpD
LDKSSSGACAPQSKQTDKSTVDRLQSQSSVERQKRRRRDRMRQAIRSVLAGVALALFAGLGVVSAETSQYTVQPGDSLNAVAERVGVSAAQLARLNDLVDGDLLQVGQVLKLPSGAEVRVAPAARGATQPSFIWPVQGPVTTGYRESGPYWSKGFHPGIDVGVPVGTAIVAAGDGVVIEAEAQGWNSGYGHYVKIDHGAGVFSLYAHMSTVSASVGDRVTAGTVIGRVGMSGFTTGPHLHWEVRLGSGALTAPTADPLSYMR